MLLELKNLFLEDGGKKDLHYEMDLSQVVFSGVRPFITPVSVTAQAENRAGAIHLKADVAFDFRCPCDRCAAETQRSYRFSFQHVAGIAHKIPVQAGLQGLVPSVRKKPE